MRGVVLHLEHRDHALLEIAVLVETDLALQRLQLRLGDRVPHVDPIDRLARPGDPLDRVDHHQHGVVGGDRIVRGLPARLGDEALDPGLHVRLLHHVRTGDGRVPAIGCREAGALQDRRTIHAVAAGLDQVRHQVIGLLGQLHTGLRVTAVVDRLCAERLDLGNRRRVVGRLRIEPVVTEHLDAALLRLRLERGGDADAVGAAVVQAVDALHLQCIGEVVRHVRPLIGVRGDGSEIDRLAGGTVQRGEFGIRDVGVGRGGRDGGEIALAEDR